VNAINKKRRSGMDDTIPGVAVTLLIVVAFVLGAIVGIQADEDIFKKHDMSRCIECHVEEK
jgi:hypothetical protein